MTAHRRAASGETVAPLGLSTGLLGLVLAADQASASYGETPWGSLPKSVETYSTRPVEDVRAAQHSCFDRIVVDVGAHGSSGVGYDVRYVDAVRGADGHTIALRGEASLLITVRAPAHDPNGRATYLPDDRSEVVPVGHYRTFDQAVWAGSREAGRRWVWAFGRGSRCGRSCCPTRAVDVGSSWTSPTRGEAHGHHAHFEQADRHDCGRSSVDRLEKSRSPRHGAPRAREVPQLWRPAHRRVADSVST